MKPIINIKLITVLLFLSLFLASCGNKGPLYIPQSDETSAATLGEH